MTDSQICKSVCWLLGGVCIVMAVYIKGPSHKYVDVITGWQCTKGGADNCEQWTKL